jgi:hypothetical protein
LGAESFAKELGARLILAIVGEKDVRHARPRWYGAQGYMTRRGRSNLALETETQ